MGKRVNFTARSVIGPASLPFGYVRFPDSTKALTVPETVNIYNIKRIEQLAKDGKIASVRILKVKVIALILLKVLKMDIPLQLK